MFPYTVNFHHSWPNRYVTRNTRVEAWTTHKTYNQVSFNNSDKQITRLPKECKFVKITNESFTHMQMDLSSRSVIQTQCLKWNMKRFLEYFNDSSRSCKKVYKMHNFIFSILQLVNDHMADLYIKGSLCFASHTCCFKLFQQSHKQIPQPCFYYCFNYCLYYCF